MAYLSLVIVMFKAVKKVNWCGYSIVPIKDSVA